MLEDDGAVHEPISQEPGTGFDPANSPMPKVLTTPALSWRGPHAALAAGASISHHAQGGGIWPDGAGMPGPQPQALHQPTRHPSEVMQGRLRWLSRLALVLSWHASVSTVPGSKGSPPGQATGRGRTMTQAAVSFAGNLTDDPQVRYTDSRIARAMFRWPSLVGGNRSRRSSPWSSGVTRPSMRPSRCRRAAGSWSWAGSSSGPGRLRMAAPDRPWRSWPRSWDRGCGGRRRRRPGRPGVPASSQGRITRLGGGQLPLVGRYLAPDGA